MKQAAEAGNVRHGEDARRKAARETGFGLCQRCAKLVQRRATEHHAQEQSVGHEGEAGLDHLANRIVGPMQAEAMESQVVGFAVEGKRGSVVDMRRAWKQRRDGRRHVPDQDGSAERPADLCEPCSNFERRFLVKKEFR